MVLEARRVGTAVATFFQEESNDVTDGFFKKRRANIEVTLILISCVKLKK